MKKLKKLISAWLPPLVWMAVIFILSGRPSVRVSPEFLLNFLFFKTLHVLEYGVLFILYLRALRQSFHQDRVVNLAAIAFVLTIFYAIVDEVHQLFVPTREGKLCDVIIDAIGAILAWYGLKHWLPKIPKRLQDWAKRWDVI